MGMGNAHCLVVVCCLAPRPSVFSAMPKILGSTDGVN